MVACKSEFCFQLVNLLPPNRHCPHRGATGMCLGGHLAFRCAFDKRVSAAVCYFATDIHSETLGKGKKSDSLKRCGEIKGELFMIWGKKDTHVPTPGRQLIYQTLTDANVVFSWVEFQDAQHAFIRDESSKGRYDPATAKICFEALMEVFHRRLYVDWGAPSGVVPEIKHVC
ncbi:hypothetical protein HDV00_010583 [Rhizophlyctis rosea]|nr:hypothetical protein HDV00_010583 [Rhizophlyctis rosea]